MVTVAGGFLVPFKTKGTINIFDISHDSTGGANELTGSRDDHEWFYHRVLWADMNGDGAKDAVTCRGKKSVFGNVLYIRSDTHIINVSPLYGFNSVCRSIHCHNTIIIGLTPIVNKEILRQTEFLFFDRNSYLATTG